MGRGRLYNQITFPNNNRTVNNQVVRNTNVSNLNILNEAANKGFSLNVSDFIKFANMMKGRDVNAIVQELLNSGQMTQEQYESLKSKANGLLGLIKLFK